MTDAVLTVFSTNTNQMTFRLTYTIAQIGVDTDLTVSLYDITAGAVVPNTDLVWPLEYYYSNIGSRKFAEFDVSHLVDGHEYRAGTARIAILNLAAVESPAGVMPVVLGGGWPGILLHEAIGHGLEADFNRKKTSAFSHLLGKRVAWDVCTIVDDAHCREGAVL